MSEQKTGSRLAHAVTAARRGKGWSKEQAAREAGISSITWKRVEEDLPVQESKLGAIEAALGWPEGHAFHLKSDRTGYPEPITMPVVLPSALAEVQAMARELNEKLDAILREHS